MFIGQQQQAAHLGGRKAWLTAAAMVCVAAADIARTAAARRATGTSSCSESSTPSITTGHLASPATAAAARRAGSARPRPRWLPAAAVEGGEGGGAAAACWGNRSWMVRHSAVFTLGCQPVDAVGSMAWAGESNGTLAGKKCSTQELT
jgi:hypothetical protein